MIAALNKYGGCNLDRKKFLQMDMPAINAAIEMAGFPEEVVKAIWKIKRNAFEVY